MFVSRAWVKLNHFLSLEVGQLHPEIVGREDPDGVNGHLLLFDDLHQISLSQQFFSGAGS